MGKVLVREAGEGAFAGEYRYVARARASAARAGVRAGREGQRRVRVRSARAARRGSCARKTASAPRSARSARWHTAPCSGGALPEIVMSGGGGWGRQSSSGSSEKGGVCGKAVCMAQAGKRWRAGRQRKWQAAGAGSVGVVCGGVVVGR